MNEIFPPGFYPKIRETLDHAQEAEAALADLSDMSEAPWYNRPRYLVSVWAVRRQFRKIATTVRLMEKVAQAEAFDIPVTLTHRRSGSPRGRVRPSAGTVPDEPPRPARAGG